MTIINCNPINKKKKYTSGPKPASIYAISRLLLCVIVVDGEDQAALEVRPGAGRGRCIEKRFHTFQRGFVVISHVLALGVTGMNLAQPFGGNLVALRVHREEVARHRAQHAVLDGLAIVDEFLEMLGHVRILSVWMLEWEHYCSCSYWVYVIENKYNQNTRHKSQETNPLGSTTYLYPDA